MVARFLPTVVLSPLAGVLADRFSRRAIMIGSDVVRAIVVLGFLFVRRPDQMWLVYVLTVFQLAFSTFFEPAKTAAIPSIVSDRELVPANAIAAVTWSVMLTLGAALGGFVAGGFGTDAAFVLDSLTYVASAILISVVRFPKRAKREKSKTTVRKALGIFRHDRGRALRKAPVATPGLFVGQTSVGNGRRNFDFARRLWRKDLSGCRQGRDGYRRAFMARGIGTAVGPCWPGVGAERHGSKCRSQLVSPFLWVALSISRSA